MAMLIMVYWLYMQQDNWHYAQQDNDGILQTAEKILTAINLGARQ